MEQLRLFDIEFPIYSITPNYKRIWNELNVLYIETDSGQYVLDNKNLNGDTLGQRRLKNKTSKLYIPRKTYYTVSQMLNSKNKIFIDSTGRVFNYKKSITVPLKFHKVIKRIRVESGEYVLHLKGIEYPIKVNARKAFEINYVGILYTSYGYILYSYESEYKKDTRRKI